MEFAFATTELRSLCESRAKATSILGSVVARELKSRLADLAASDSVTGYAALFPDDIGERSSTERYIKLSSGHRLTFCAGHVRIPLTNSGATDWEKVSRIKFIALEPADE